MKMLSYALFDMKSGAYGVPFFCPHEGVARRMIADLASDPNTTVCRHPADFALYCVGSFDINSGHMSGEATPVFVCNCIEYAAKPTAGLNLNAPMEKEI